MRQVCNAVAKKGYYVAWIDCRGSFKEDNCIFNVTITYTIRPGSKRKFDLSNVGTVVDKFFCDCLVHSGILEDDNYAIVNGVSYVLGTPNTCKDTVVDIEIRGFIYED